MAQIPSSMSTYCYISNEYTYYLLIYRLDMESEANTAESMNDSFSHYAVTNKRNGTTDLMFEDYQYEFSSERAKLLLKINDSVRKYK